MICGKSHRDDVGIIKYNSRRLDQELWNDFENIHVYVDNLISFKYKKTS
jgi:hypothetical protein